MVGLAEHHVIDVLEYELEDAAIRGDWKKAEKLLREHPVEITPSTTVNECGDTALHRATVHDQTEFVHNLVGMMSEEELGIQTHFRETSFRCAISFGHVECAMIMLKKKPDLATTPIRFGRVDYLPIQLAAKFQHNGMVSCLYEASKCNMLEIDGRTDLLLTLIDNGVNDTAKEMLSDYPELATRENSQGKIAFYAIAGKASVSRTRETFQDLERNGLMRELLKHANGRAHLIKELFKAAEEGDNEFIDEVIRAYPDLATELDKQNHTIFHVGVLHRHMNVFKILVDATGSIIRSTDTDGNDILHLAAKLPLTGLELLPAAGLELVLQLQRELHFFEEVKKVVGRQHVDPKNKKRYVLLFYKEHEELRRKAEEWLTKISSSGMTIAAHVFVVGTVTIFMQPGSYENDTGVSILLIGISSAATFSLSFASLISLFSIHTSSFSTKNLVQSLASRFLFGFSILCLSIVALFSAFTVAFFIHFKNMRPRMCYSVVVVAFVLLIVTFYLHLPLIFQVFPCAIMPLHSSRTNRKCFDVPNFWTNIRKFWPKIRGARIFRNR